MWAHARTSRLRIALSENTTAADTPGTWHRDSVNTIVGILRKIRCRCRAEANLLAGPTIICTRFLFHTVDALIGLRNVGTRAMRLEASLLRLF